MLVSAVTPSWLTRTAILLRRFSSALNITHHEGNRRINPMAFPIKIPTQSIMRQNCPVFQRFCKPLVLCITDNNQRGGKNVEKTWVYTRDEVYLY